MKEKKKPMNSLRYVRLWQKIWHQAIGTARSVQLSQKQKRNNEKKKVLHSVNTGRSLTLPANNMQIISLVTTEATVDRKTLEYCDSAELTSWLGFSNLSVFIYWYKINAIHNFTFNLTRKNHIFFIYLSKFVLIRMFVWYCVNVYEPQLTWMSRSVC